MKKQREFSCEEDRIAADAVDVAYQVHNALGPGLLESAYSQLFCHWLRKRGYQVETEVSVPIEVDGLRIATGFRADVIINGILIIELKSVRAIEDVFLKQLLTYVRLSGMRLGLLINFGAASLDGQIKRVANGLPEV
jgi:GxxExxY protein